MNEQEAERRVGRAILNALQNADALTIRIFPLDRPPAPPPSVDVRVSAEGMFQQWQEELFPDADRQERGAVIARAVEKCGALLWIPQQPESKSASPAPLHPEIAETRAVLSLRWPPFAATPPTDADLPTLARAYADATAERVRTLINEKNAALRAPEITFEQARAFLAALWPEGDFAYHSNHARTFFEAHLGKVPRPGDTLSSTWGRNEAAPLCDLLRRIADALEGGPAAPTFPDDDTPF